MALRAEMESALGMRLSWQPRAAVETISTGVAGVDAALGGFPRGAVTELTGPACSGRTSLLVAALAAPARREEVCALVDTADAFDPAAAAAAGVALDRLLWVRCAGNAEHALKATDLLLQSGGFGVVAMDLGDTPPAVARRISLASWFRLRRAVQDTPTVLLVVAREPVAAASAALSVEMRRGRVAWSGAPGCSRLLRGIGFRAEPRKPALAGRADFELRALG